MTDQRTEIAPPDGKLGVLLPGMGAVATTFIAGVYAVRRGLAKPIGSLSQMNTIRLGKRTDGRSPLIRDFVPLARMDDLAFGGWDPIGDNVHQAMLRAQVLSPEHIDAVRQRIRWGDRTVVRPIDGGRCRLRIRMQQTSLFAFRWSTAEVPDEA